MRLKCSKKTWFIDEIFLKIKGVKCYLYRCIDTSGNLVNYHLSYRRDTKSIKKLFKKCLAIAKSKPSKVVTDGYICYSLAMNKLLPKAKHVVVKPSMNYIEQNNRWIRQRTRATVGLKNFAGCEILCSIFEELKNFFRPQKYKNQNVSDKRKRKIFIERYCLLLNVFENIIGLES
jgi:putative transposase